MPIYDQNGEYLGSADSGPCPHDQMEQTGRECQEGCCDYYRCLRCGETIRVEVPD